MPPSAIFDALVLSILANVQEVGFPKDGNLWFPLREIAKDRLE